MKKILFATLLLSLLCTPASADILIGVSTPLTGSAAAFGEQSREGIKAALAEINKTGVLGGQKIKVVYEDDACDAKQGVAAANRLVSLGVTGILGPLCSMATIPASEIFAEEGLPEVTISTHSDVTGRGLKNLARLNGRDSQQAEFIYQYIQKTHPGKRIALLHDKQAWGKSLTDNVRAALVKSGVKPVLIDSVNLGDKDFSATISRMKKEKIDVVVMGLFPVEAGLMVRQAREQKLQSAFIGGDALLNADFWKVAGKLGEGVVFSGPFDPRQNDAGRKAVEQIEAQKGKAELYTLYMYASMQVMAQAIEKAGSAESSKIVAALHSSEFDTLIGPVSFDKNGDMTKPLWKFYQWIDGDYQLMNGGL